MRLKQNNMKKTTYLLAISSIFLAVSCGPSAEEKAAEEKRLADSVAAATAARIQDSLAVVEAARQDSINAAMQAQADSLAAKAAADSAAAAQKKSTPRTKPAPAKTKEEQKIEKQIKEVKDATRGRG